MFFKSIEPHLIGMNLNIVISKSEAGLVVSVLPQLTCKDEAKGNIVPILLKGTPEELDAQFAGIIQEPLQKVSGISTNLIQFEKSVEETEKQNAITKAKKEEKKKITDKADKLLKEAEAFIEKDDVKKAILKIEGALKFAPDYKKAKDMLAKHKPQPAGMFAETTQVIEESKKTVEATPEVVEAVIKAETVEEVKEILEPKVEAPAPTVVEPVTATPEPQVAVVEETPIAIEPEVPMEKREAPKGPNVIINKVPANPTSMKEVGMEEQQKQEKEPQIAVYDKVDANGKPTRQDMEPMSNFESRLAKWNFENPVAENPAATIPSATPVEAPKSELEVMTEEETARREAAFEAEKVVEPIKVETPTSSTNNNIEILG